MEKKLFYFLRIILEILLKKKFSPRHRTVSMVIKNGNV